MLVEVALLVSVLVTTADDGDVDIIEVRRLFIRAFVGCCCTDVVFVIADTDAVIWGDI